MIESYIPNGSHNSGDISAVVPEKPSAATPTIVTEWPFSQRLDPTTPTLPRRRQKASLMTAHGIVSPRNFFLGQKTTPSGHGNAKGVEVV